MPSGCFPFEPIMSVIKKVASVFLRYLPASCRRHLRRPYYLRVVAGYRETDWEWTPVIRKIVAPGSHILDVGANVGYLSKLFAEWVGSSGRVVSVEPIPDTFASLEYSMNKLFGRRVTTLAVCMSDHPGSVRMVVPSYEKGGENFYESHIENGGNRENAGRHFTVRASTIDLVCQETGITPGFIKIDVEGHEGAVVRGAEHLLSTRQPPLLIEVAGNPDDPAGAAHEMFLLLRKWGYVPLMLENGRCRERKTGDVAVDYFFVHESGLQNIIK
jgi:FkbM family methyltransferase